MQTFILERSSAGVFGYRVFNSNISTQLFFVQTKMGVVETDRNRGKLYKKFKQLNGVLETKGGVRRIGDELNKD
jgi:hypothetical protein